MGAALPQSYSLPVAGRVWLTGPQDHDGVGCLLHCGISSRALSCCWQLPLCSCLMRQTDRQTDTSPPRPWSDPPCHPPGAIHQPSAPAVGVARPGFATMGGEGGGGWDSAALIPCLPTPGPVAAPIHSTSSSQQPLHRSRPASASPPSPSTPTNPDPPFSSPSPGSWCVWGYRGNVPQCTLGCQKGDAAGLTLARACMAQCCPPSGKQPVLIKTSPSALPLPAAALAHVLDLLTLLRTTHSPLPSALLPLPPPALPTGDQVSLSLAHLPTPVSGRPTGDQTRPDPTRPDHPEASPVSWIVLAAVAAITPDLPSPPRFCCCTTNWDTAGFRHLQTPRAVCSTTTPRTAHSLIPP